MIVSGGGATRGHRQRWRATALLTNAWTALCSCCRVHAGRTPRRGPAQNHSFGAALDLRHICGGGYALNRLLDAPPTTVHPEPRANAQTVWRGSTWSFSGVENRAGIVLSLRQEAGICLDRRSGSRCRRSARLPRASCLRWSGPEPCGGLGRKMGPDSSLAPTPAANTTRSTTPGHRRRSRAHRRPAGSGVRVDRQPPDCVGKHSSGGGR